MTLNLNSWKKSIGFLNKVKGKLGKLSMSTFSSGQYFETFENEIVDKRNGMEGVNHVVMSWYFQEFL